LNNTMVDIFSNEDIEVITDEEVKNEQTAIIPIEELLNQNNQSQITTKKEKQKDKILIVQIILLVTWAILTAVIYFFGYDFFEQFIKVK